MQEKTSEIKSLMDIGQVAAYINLSTSRIYKMVAKKEIPHIRVATKILFDKVDIESWLNQRKISVRKTKRA
jgi:excisionase family DNA binding protein